MSDGKSTANWKEGAVEVPDVKMNVELQGPKWRRKERMMNSVMKGLKEMEEYGYAPSIPVQISFAMMMVILTYSC